MPYSFVLSSLAEAPQAIAKDFRRRPTEPLPMLSATGKVRSQATSPAGDTSRCFFRPPAFGELTGSQSGGLHHRQFLYRPPGLVYLILRERFLLGFFRGASTAGRGFGETLLGRLDQRRDR